MARSDTPKRMIPDSVAARLERPAIIKTPLAIKAQPKEKRPINPANRRKASKAVPRNVVGACAILAIMPGPSIDATRPIGRTHLRA